MVFRKASPFWCFRIQLLTASRSLGLSLRKATAKAATGSHGNVFVNGDPGEHLSPELGQVVVHDRDRRRDRH